MEIEFLGTGAGQPSTKRNVSSLALKLLEEINEIWLFDAGEATQHQILQTNIRPRKIRRIFISHNHGDHIFGLPGLLASRSFQGEDVGPLTIYGPSGLEQFVRTALRISRTRLSYPVRFVDVSEGGKILAGRHFDVFAARLDHRIPSFGYRVVEKDRPGELLMDKVKKAGVPRGPLLGQLKAGQLVTLPDGRQLDGHDFIGPAKPGRVITIIGDTRPAKNSYQLAQGADVLVHESTFAAGEEKLARSYFHSTCLQAAQIAKKAGVKRLFLDHVSARYTGPAGRQMEQQARKVFPQTDLVQDFSSYEIPMKG
jgi:ribonuclease Z